MNFYDDIEKYNSKTAIITDQSEEFSYKEVLEIANEIGKQVRKRCLVFLICKNSIESVAAYIGLLRVRAVPVLINEKIDDAFLSNLIAAYSPDYIFLPTVKALPIPFFRSVRSINDYTLLKNDSIIDCKINRELALLLTTSGSTGSPKFVRQSYKNINSNSVAISQYHKIEEGDRPITTMPMSYTYGLSIINSHLLKGASIVLTEYTLMEKKFWELMRTHNVTTFGGVPYIYEMLKKLRFFQMDLPTLKYITQAGGKLSTELSAEFADVCARKSIEFIVMYGQTEATARMSYLPWAYSRKKAGSIGIPIPGGRFWLEDENGQVIDENNIPGELIYQGENVTMGYASNRIELGKGDENAGVLHTGDIAKRDDDGFYYIVGRKKRFLKIFGNRINLDEVELFLKKDGYDCICTGSDDNLKIYVTNLKNANQLKKYVSNRIGLNQAGLSVMPIDKIPRNASGKVMYSMLD